MQEMENSLIMVPRANIALQHTLGAGGATVVAMYKKGFADVTPRAVAAAGNPEDKVFKNRKILEDAMENDTDNLIEKVRDIYGFDVKNGPSGAESYWAINAREGKGKVSYNGSEKPDATFTVSDTDVVDFISGILNPQKAFFQDKFKIQGNMKLTELLRQAAGRIDVIRSKL